MNYTTEECKKYLITIYKDTQESGWKRVRKYKDEEKRVARDFEYNDGRTATILETSTGLKDKSLLNPPKVVKPDPKNNPFAKFKAPITTPKSNENNNGKDNDNKDKNYKTTSPNSSNPNEKEKFENFMNKVLSGESPSAHQNTSLNNNSPQKKELPPAKSSIEMMRDHLKELEEKNKNPQNDFLGLGSMPLIYLESIIDHRSPLEPFVKARENVVTQLLECVAFNTIDTVQEKFLYVLVNGTQWSNPRGDQASTDFYPKIDKKEKEEFLINLINREVDLPNMYLLHMINTAVGVEAQDEGYIPFHVMQGEEALADMCNILQDIIKIYEKNGKKVSFEPELIEASLSTLQSLKETFSMNDSEDKWTQQEVEEELDKLINLIKDKSPKKAMKP